MYGSGGSTNRALRVPERSRDTTTPSGSSSETAPSGRNNVLVSASRRISTRRRTAPELAGPRTIGCPARTGSDSLCSRPSTQEPARYRRIVAPARRSQSGEIRFASMPGNDTRMTTRRESLMSPIPWRATASRNPLVDRAPNGAPANGDRSRGRRRKTGTAAIVATATVPATRRTGGQPALCRPRDPSSSSEIATNRPISTSRKVSSAGRYSASEGWVEDAMPATPTRPSIAAVRAPRERWPLPGSRTAATRMASCAIGRSTPYLTPPAATTAIRITGASTFSIHGRSGGTARRLVRTRSATAAKAATNGQLATPVNGNGSATASASAANHRCRSTTRVISAPPGGRPTRPQSMPAAGPRRGPRAGPARAVRGACGRAHSRWRAASPYRRPRGPRARRDATR